MSGAVVFNFFSDTNQKLALGELQQLGLDELTEDSFSIHVGQADYDAVGDEIRNIMDAYGAEEEV